MNALRLLPVRDVVTALKRHEPVRALRISGNLCSNAVSTARMHLHRSIPLSSRRGRTS
jgi:hypothetical protein